MFLSAAHDMLSTDVIFVEYFCKCNGYLDCLEKVKMSVVKTFVHQTQIYINVTKRYIFSLLGDAYAYPKHTSVSVFVAGFAMQDFIV